MLRLNIAEIISETTAFGEDLQSVLYVRGCAQRCSGCIAEAWQNPEPARWIDIHDAARLLLKSSSVTGIVISGGEPFLQAPALAALIDLIKEKADKMIFISYSGYTLEQLLKRSDSNGLLTRLDILIDGPYIRSKNNGQGKAGSTNQAIHFLSSRVSRDEFTKSTPRKTHMIFGEGEVFVSGVPSSVITNSMHGFFQRIVENVRI